MGAFGAGLLGFVAGAAKGGLDVIDREEDMADERRRMFAEEMKMRRMAEFGVTLRAQEERAKLESLGGAGFWEENPDLKQIGAVGGSSAVASALSGDRTAARQEADRIEQERRAQAAQLEQERRAEERQIEKEARTPIQASPGTTFISQEEARERMQSGGGTWSTAPRTATNREQISALNDVFKQADSLVGQGAARYNTTYENRLLTADMRDIESDEEKAVAFSALITDVASAAAQAEIKDIVRANPSSVESLTPDYVVAKVREQEQVVQESLQEVIARYQAVLKQSGIQDDAQKREFIRKIINEGYKDSSGQLFNPAQVMKDNYMWSPTFANIIINTLAYGSPVSQQAPIFQMQQ